MPHAHSNESNAQDETIMACWAACKAAPRCTATRLPHTSVRQPRKSSRSDPACDVMLGWGPS